jgi:hypothetical protein
MGSVPTFPLALVKKGDILESMQGYTACQLKPTLFWPDKPKFPVVTAVFSGRGGAVIFIFLSRGNPVKYTDPDGRVVQAAILPAGIGAGAIIGVTVGAGVLTILATLTLNNIKEWAQEKLSSERNNTEYHHAFPMFLGGSRSQNLVPMERSRHVNLHKDLRNFLKSHYEEMEPKANNSGPMIQAKFPIEKRKEAMARFYLTHIDTYVDAASQFFTDNPEMFNQENIEWAENHAVGIRAKDYAFGLFTSPTEE